MSHAAAHGISLLLLRPLARVIGQIGDDADAFLAALGIDASMPDDAYVDAAKVDRALDALASSRRDPSFGLTLARTAVKHPLGFIDHLVWPGATLRDAVLRSARFFSLFTRRSTLLLHETSGSPSASVVQRVAEGAPRGTVLTELAFASLVLRARHAAGGLSVAAVRFVHDGAASAAYESVFEAPVFFAQSEDALELAAAELDRALGTADAVTASALEAQAERMTESVAPGDPFLQRIRAGILANLRDPTTGLPELARELGISERTLQRRLREHGTSLRELVDDVRKDAAIRLLREGASATTVAYALGFSHPQALHKAFLRWTGRRPGTFRGR